MWKRDDEPSKPMGAQRGKKHTIQKTVLTTIYTHKAHNTSHIRSYNINIRICMSYIYM